MGQAEIKESQIFWKFILDSKKVISFEIVGALFPHSGLGPIPKPMCKRRRRRLFTKFVIIFRWVSSFFSLRPISSLFPSDCSTKVFNFVPKNNKIINFFTFSSQFHFWLLAAFPPYSPKSFENYCQQEFHFCTDYLIPIFSHFV